MRPSVCITAPERECGPWNVAMSRPTKMPRPFANGRITLLVPYLEGDTSEMKLLKKLFVIGFVVGITAGSGSRP